jgi:hypothetical protein
LQKVLYILEIQQVVGKKKKTGLKAKEIEWGKTTKGITGLDRLRESQQARPQTTSNTKIVT